MATFGSINFWPNIEPSKTHFSPKRAFFWPFSLWILIPCGSLNVLGHSFFFFLLVDHPAGGFYDWLGVF